MRLAIFDIDGTIVRGISCEQLLFQKLYKDRIIGKAQLWAYAGFLAHWWTKLGPTVIKRNKSYLCDLPVEQVENAARELVAKELPGHFNQKVLDRIREHAGKGDTLVLLTGTPQFLAEPIGRKLVIQHVIGSQLRSVDGVFTGDPPLVHPFGKDKVRLAEELGLNLGCRLSEASAYADSGDDLPLLEAAGTPVAVAPGRRLRESAKQRGWEIIE